MEKKRMTIDGLRPIEKLHFLSCFAIDYRTKSGKKKVWELVSRGDRKRLERELFEGASYTDGAMVLATTADRQQVVILKEHRISAGRDVYMFPAGLIETGEDVAEAAVREFREETGLILTPLYTERERYVSVGIINEKVNIVYGTFEGSPTASHQSDNEEAEILLIDREEARRILAEEEVAIRTAMLLQAFFSLNPFIHGGD
jgi:ADP-ribose pyrophosphatase